jgi:glutathione peroxidase-family protein
LYDQFADTKGLRVLAFPCNQFGNQEPWSNEEIKKYAVEKFGVKFDLFSKIEVNGDKAHPLFKYLKSQQGGLFGSFIKWSFTKFLIDKNGQPVARYAPNVEPFTIAKDFDKFW